LVGAIVLREWTTTGSLDSQSEGWALEESACSGGARPAAEPALRLANRMRRGVCRDVPPRPAMECRLGQEDFLMSEKQSNMYRNAETWNPFKGCQFDCTYCRHSFQRQSMRQKQSCKRCYRYEPHCHEDRLVGSIPSTGIVFVGGNGDIAFCPIGFTRKIIRAIKEHLLRCRKSKTFYFQSKKPSYFQPILADLPPEVILLTTLETNRDAGYRQVSMAPTPSDRYRQFKDLDYPRKVVTIEPVMDFDEDVFPQWIVDLKPEYVWLGFNSRPESVTLSEPSVEKLRTLVRVLVQAGIEVRGKELRGLDLGISE